MRTRKNQVLSYLQSHKNQWVDGPNLANEQVGGSEGLRRLRELLEDGFNIKARRHPNVQRDIWQYMLVSDVPISPIRQTDGGYEYVPQPSMKAPEPAAISEERPIDNTMFDEMPTRLDFGSILVCPRCRGKTKKSVYKEGLRHRDPHRKKSPCLGCNGWGVIPNTGPIPWLPEKPAGKAFPRD